MSNKEKESQPATEKAHYGYLRALYLSFYSSRIYVDVAKRWRGFALIYLLLVIVITSIPYSYRILVDFYRYFDAEIIAPFEVLPLLYIKDGQAFLPPPMPRTIKNIHGEAVAIVDLSGKITKIDDTYPQLMILITKDKLYFRPPSLKQFAGISTSFSGNTVYAHTFGTSVNGVFYGAAWLKDSGFLKLKTYVKYIIFPAVPLIFFVVYCLFLLVFSTMGQLCSYTFYKLDLSYKQIFRMLTVASTAQILLFFLGHAANWNFLGLGFIYFILIAGYFFYALTSVKRADSAPAPG